MKVSNWGKYPVVDGPVQQYAPGQLINGQSSWIPRGMGRCYGDASLGERMIGSQRLNRFLAFDPQTGILTCESGLTYEDLLRVMVPKGWFPPVTPGTKFVSLGGALASDVHGKNHHTEGSISQYVHHFQLLTAKGEVLNCSRTEHPDVFWATLGGMGLTGMILSLSIRLKPIQTSAINSISSKAGNLEEIMALMDETKAATYSVAWIDTVSGGKRQGRSILSYGEHASLEEVQGTPWEKDPLRLPAAKAIAVPIDFPAFVLNPWSIGAFNFLYYHKQLKKEVHKISSYDPFFYPLDNIHHWNRVYGKRGFTQYQLVIPRSAGKTVIPDILNRMRKARLGSFLSVLKLMGNETQMLSFPLAGYTLTLDFPISDKLFPFLDTLDRLLLDCGGRIYLTKDVRLSGESLKKMYPDLPKFQQVIRELDPYGYIRSLQSQRLNIHST
ncbi:MAG: FAD-binding oxidoreductase [Bacteroidota bacterium]